MSGKKSGGIIWKAILKIALTGIIAITLVIGAFTLYLFKTIQPYGINLNEVKAELTGTAKTGSTPGANDEAVATLKTCNGRFWVDLPEVPKNLTNAIVSTEDQKFYTNDGVDKKRTLAAAANTVFHFYKTEEGGSTITQQVIKNLEGNVNDRTYKNKLREIVTALDLNKQYSKKEILEIYINIITLGNGSYGVQAASKLYFGKDVQELDLAQCAALAGIIPSPNQTYNPYKNLKSVYTRRNYVLKNMLDQGMISKVQYTQAINETLSLMPHNT